MKACVVYLDENISRSIDCEKTLEDAGCLVLSARHEARAVELLSVHRVDVVCIAAPGGDLRERGLGSSIKSSRPDVPVVLIRDPGAIVTDFERYVDVVIDEPDFKATARWLIEELQHTDDTFFVRWFVNWMNRPSQLKNEASISDC